MAGADQPSPWWSPARHADRKPFLMARNAITSAVRAWFDEQGFTEVETAILQISPGNETHLHVNQATDLSILPVGLKRIRGHAAVLVISNAAPAAINYGSGTLGCAPRFTVI